MSESRPTEEETKNRTRKILNLKCLQKLFKGVKDIVCMSKSSTAYYFDHTARIWLKVDAAGPLFVCTSSEDASLRVILLNQNNNKDILLKSDDFSRVSLIQSDSILHIYTKNDAIKGFWVYDPAELMRIFDALKQVVPNHKIIPDKPLK